MANEWAGGSANERTLMCSARTAEPSQMHTEKERPEWGN